MFLGFAPRRSRPREDRVEIGDPGIADEDLLAAQDEAAPLTRRGGADVREVAPRFALGHGERRDRLPRRDSRQPLLCQQCVPRQRDRIRAEPLEDEAGVGEAALVCQLFADHTNRTEIEDREAPAEILRNAQIEELALGERRDERARGTVLVELAPLETLTDRRALFLGEALRVLGEGEVDVVEEEVLEGAGSHRWDLESWDS